MPSRPSSKTWNSPVGPAPMMTTSAWIGVCVTVMQESLDQVIGELVADIRWVGMPGRGIPLGYPVERAQNREHGDLAVEPGFEAAVCDPRVNQPHEDLLVAAALVERAGQIRLGQEAPLVEYNQ